VACLEVIDDTEELEKVHVNYEEQIARKLEFDCKIQSWIEIREQCRPHEGGVTQADLQVQVLYHWP